MRSLTPPPSAHNRVVGGGVGAAALEQGHLGALPHTLQRQEVSARAGTASWEESAGCGRAEPPCRPFPAPTPHPAAGTPGRSQGGWATPAKPQPWRRPSGQHLPHKPASHAPARGSISAFGMAGLHSACWGWGAQPCGCSGSSSCCDWRESSCLFSASQPTTTPPHLRRPAWSPRV